MNVPILLYHGVVAAFECANINDHINFGCAIVQGLLVEHPCAICLRCDVPCAPGGQQVGIVGLGQEETSLRHPLQLRPGQDRAGAEDIAIVCGGVIPRQDYGELYAAGAARIFGPGTPIVTSATQTLDAIEEKQK